MNFGAEGIIAQNGLAAIAILEILFLLRETVLL